eukprot:ANDGO_03760.mRNA.1 NH(3)-dependent NAD(+) synthetase
MSYVPPGASREHHFADVNERAAVEEKYIKDCKLQAVINSLSGGIDSTTSALIAKKSCPNGAIGIILPCSSEDELKGERLKDIVDAHRVADHLNMPVVEVNLSSLWKAMADTYAKAAREMSEKSGLPLDEKKLNWAINNLKPTLRLSCGGFFADAFGGITQGTDNAVENFLGYFSIRGDGIADRQPIRDCTKAEVRQIAQTGGFPEDLVTRIPTAGLWPGQTDEGELGFKYDEADAFLVWVLERHVEATQNSKSAAGWLDDTMTVIPEAIDAILAHSSLPVAPESAKKIIAQNRKTQFKRKSHDLQIILQKRKLIA